MIRRIAIGMYWLSVLVILLGIFSVTLGQVLPVEFTDSNTRSTFYDWLFQSLPVAVLLLPFGLARRNAITKWLLATSIGLAAILAVLTYVALVGVFMWQIGFASWIDYWVIYHKRTDPKIRIVDQLYDVGAFGYGGHRLVQVRPLTGVFTVVTPVDTGSLNKGEWLLVNKEGEGY
jgi:hypothetical protein